MPKKSRDSRGTPAVRRLWVVGAVAVAAVAVLIGFGMSQRGDMEDQPDDQYIAEGNTRGKDTAGLTIVEFGDYG